MAGGLQVPASKVEVAFTSSTFAASPTWTDITRYVLGYTSTAGRQHELQQVNPSTAVIQLMNQPVSTADPGGRFSPWNTSSPYYHSGSGLTPGHPVRITATASSTTYNIFYGYTQSWVPKYGQSASTMTLNCYDAMALLNLNTLDTGQYENTVSADSPLAYYELADPIGSTTAADAMGGTAATVSGSVSFGQPGALASDVSTSALSSAGVGSAFLNLPASVSGTAVSVTGWVKTTTPTPGSSLIVSYNGTTALLLGVATSSGVAEATIGTHTLTGPNVADGAWHFLAVTGDGTTMRLYVDGAQVANTACTSSVTSHTGIGATSGGPPAGYAHIAVYDTTLTPAQIETQYQIGTAGFVVQDSGARINAILALAGIPAGLNNVGAGVVNVQAVTSPLTTTTAASYLQQVVNTERGMLYQDPTGVLQFRNRDYVYNTSSSNTSQATFGYASGQLHYFSSNLVPGEDDTDLWNNVPVGRQGGVVQRASDATSISNYGRRTLQGYTSLLFEADEDAADLAQFLLYQYKNPQPRVRGITMDSTIGNGANIAQMLGRGLLDRITINWRPLDGSSADFSQQSLIEQITHTVTPEKWTTTWAVTPIGTEAFGVYGTGQYGTAVYGP